MNSWRMKWLSCWFYTSNSCSLCLYNLLRGKYRSCCQCFAWNIIKKSSNEALLCNYLSILCRISFSFSLNLFFFARDRDVSEALNYIVDSAPLFYMIQVATSNNYIVVIIALSNVRLNAFLQGCTKCSHIVCI